MACDHNEGPQHDCAYIERRNKLIPLAEAHAHSKFMHTQEPYEGFIEEWGAEFLKEMDRLYNQSLALDEIAIEDAQEESASSDAIRN